MSTHKMNMTILNTLNQTWTKTAFVLGSQHIAKFLSIFYHMFPMTIKSYKT